MKTNGCSLVGRLLLVALFLLANPAVGQETPKSVDCTRDPGCLALKEQAADNSKKGNLIEALRLYKLAYEVQPDPRLLFNIARLLHKQGKPAEAEPYYRRFLESPVQEEEQRQKAREYLEQLQVDAMAPKPLQALTVPPTPSVSLKQEATNSPTVVMGERQPAGKPVYKKWWFWTIIGGVVTAGVVAGVVGGAAASQRLPDPVFYPFGS